MKRQAHSCTFSHLLCRLSFDIPAEMKLEGSELGKSSDPTWSIKALKRKAIFLLLHFLLTDRPFPSRCEPHYESEVKFKTQVQNVSYGSWVRVPFTPEFFSGVLSATG